jgi:hypothetical protein
MHATPSGPRGPTVGCDAFWCVLRHVSFGCRKDKRCVMWSVAKHNPTEHKSIWLFGTLAFAILSGGMVMLTIGGLAWTKRWPPKDEQKQKTWVSHRFVRQNAAIPAREVACTWSLYLRQHVHVFRVIRNGRGHCNHFRKTSPTVKCTTPCVARVCK